MQANLRLSDFKLLSSPYLHLALCLIYFYKIIVLVKLFCNLLMHKYYPPKKKSKEKKVLCGDSFPWFFHVSMGMMQQKILHTYTYKSQIKDATNWSKGCVKVFVKGHFTALQNAWNVDTTLPQHSSVFTEIAGQSNLSFIKDTRKLLHLKPCSHVAHLHWNCLSTSHHQLYLCHLLTGKVFFGERRWGSIEKKAPHDRKL